MKKILCGALSLLTATVFAVWQDDHLPEIFALNAEKLQPVTLAQDWTFREGMPEEGWQNARAEGKTFRLKDSKIDLDTVAGKTGDLKSHAVLYCTITSPADGIAEIGIGCDWYFEAYVNGTLCATTMKDGNGDSSYQPSNHPFFIPVKRGENLLAIHTGRGSYTWSFACAKVPFRLPDVPEIAVGPWLDNPGPGRMTVRFTSLGNCGAGVEYRTKGTNPWQTAWDAVEELIQRRSFHTVELENLTPGAQYEYRIVMLDPAKPKDLVYPRKGEIYTFTAPDEKKERFSFLFTADLQFVPEKQNEIFSALLKAGGVETCDFVLLGGDIGSSFSIDSLLNTVWKLNAENGGSARPLIWIRGNHEFLGDTERYIECCGTPEGKTYGFFRFGSTAFLRLDSYALGNWKSERAEYTLPAAFAAKQQAFVKQVMDSPAWKNAKHRIVIAHSAPFSVGGFEESITRMTASMIAPYYRGRKSDAPVALMLTGHTHAYTRTIPGTTQAAALVPPQTKAPCDGKNYPFPVVAGLGPEAETPFAASVFRIDVAPEKLTVQSFRPDGTCLEKFEIMNDGRVKELLSLPHFDTVKK